MPDVRRYQLIAIVAAVLALTVAFVRPKESPAPTNTNHAANTNGGTNTNTTAGNTTANTNTAVETDMFYAADLPDADPVFNFSMLLQAGWVAEYDAATKAILVSDPHATGAKKLRLKITYYRGQTVATPTGTIIPNTQAGSVLGNENGPPVAQVKVITAAQIPSWGDQAHWEYDVQALGVDKLYYRFDFAPDLSFEAQTKLLNSLDFGGSER
jgi:hypothetical protein